MHVVIYRWRIRPERRDDFVEAWTAVTQRYLGEGSGGSALFTSEDGMLTAIARWPDLETFNAATAAPSSEALAAKMADAVLERFPPLHLTEIANLWTPLSSSKPGP